MFIKETTKANRGKPIGLLRGAGTRFATMWYAMHRALRLKSALLSTIHNPHFANLSIVKSNDRVRLAVLDVKNEGFWHAIYILLRSCFPALRALRFCDAGVPNMDKLYYLSHKATMALEFSTETLNKKTTFSSLKDDGGVGFESTEIFGTYEKVDQAL